MDVQLSKTQEEEDDENIQSKTPDILIDQIINEPLTPIFSKNDFSTNAPQQSILLNEAFIESSNMFDGQTLKLKSMDFLELLE